MMPESHVPGELKIVVLSDAAPSRNGVGAYYQDLVEQLSSKVGQIKMVSPVIRDGKWHGGLVLPLPGDKTQKLCLPNILKLKRLLEQMQPDIMIVATPGVYGLCGAWLASRKQIPFLTGFHTSFEKLTELYWPDSLRGKIVEFYFRHSNAYLFKRSEAVLGNSASILRQASAMGAPQVKLIGTPISAEFAQHPLADYHGKFQKLLFAGRLAKEKNIEAIIDCAAQLPQLNFSIAGDGPLRDLVLEAAGNLENLDYLGWLSRDDLRRTVDSHDALLLPSWFETFGTIALESMARQRPVIVSRGCGISDWPDLAETLFVIGRDENLYATLLSIMQMPRQKRLEKVAAAYNAALAFNNRVAKSWCELLTDTLNHYHAGHNFHS